jgi:hypothetical protein
MTNSTRKGGQTLKITVSYELSLKKWRRSAPLNDANGKKNLRAEPRIRFRPAQTRVSRATRTRPVLDGSFPREKIQRLHPFLLARHRRSPRPRRLLHRRGRIPTAWTSDRPRSPLVAVRRSPFLPGPSEAFRPPPTSRRWSRPRA